MSVGVHATALSQALLVHRVPPLPVFSGEGDGIGGPSVSGMSSQRWWPARASGVSR